MQSNGGVPPHQDHRGAANRCTVCDLEFLATQAPLWKDHRLIIILVSALLLVIGLIFEFIVKHEVFAQALFLSAAAMSGFDITRKGVSSLVLERKLNIDFLVVMAAIGSFSIGHGEEGAAVVCLFYVAEFLESYATNRARRSVASLLRIAPDVATVKRGGKETQVHLHDVIINETVVVRPGDRIPLDGSVIRGISSVNQAPITGESIPVTKQVGDQVYAGTINNEGVLEVRVDKKSDETLLSTIIRLVAEAQKIKSPTEKFIEKFSQYYTPTVILLAMAVAAVPPLVFHGVFTEWFYRALVLLVVSCPCALAISTPVAMVSAITSATRSGILIKRSAVVEEIGNIQLFAFDKTGTLTAGQLMVTDVVGLGYSKEEVLRKAAYLEASSEHPLAKAIVEKAQEAELPLGDVGNFRAIIGKGVRGELGGELWYLGSRRLFEELSVDTPDVQIGKLEDEGKTVLLVGHEKEVVGLIAVADKVREGTIQNIGELKRMGIRTAMLTGDNERTAVALARRIGVDEYHADLLPDEKVQAIRDYLTRDYGRVAMVGDGINDAPALAIATVGIAMGAMGSDVAIETADVALMQDDLSKLPYFVRLSKKTMSIVKQNTIASILIKGSFAILAFPGLITLWLAVAIGDMGLSLAVIVNALRLSCVKPPV